MIVGTINHLWLVNSHHKGHSNADMTSLPKIITWLQKYSWYHLWDHFSGLILDTSATVNVWFNSDFTSLSEFSYTYLHQASKHQQQIHVKNRTGPHQSADIHIGIYFPLFLSFLLPTLSSCFFYHVLFPIFPVTFLPDTFFPPHCYLFPVPFFPVTFFRGKIVTFFPVSLSPSRLLPFFLLLFFLLLFSYPKLLLFSCYLCSCYFLSEHRNNSAHHAWSICHTEQSQGEPFKCNDL